GNYYSTRLSFPERASHETTEAFPLPTARRSPSGEKAREVTVRSWPFRVLRDFPETGSQIITVRSSPPVAIMVPSGEKAIAFTVALCFLSCRFQAPVCKSQSLIIPPSLALASDL